MAVSSDGKIRTWEISELHTVDNTDDEHILPTEPNYGTLLLSRVLLFMTHIHASSATIFHAIQSVALRMASSDMVL